MMAKTGLAHRFLGAALLSGLTLGWLAFPTQAQDRPRPKGPNYQQAMQFNSQYLKQFVYDSGVNPQWIGKTDQFWYEFRTSTGKHYWRVNPTQASKTPLFDRDKLGSQLSEAVKKPLDAALLPIQQLTMNEEGTKLKFVTEDSQFEYELASEKLTKLGKAPAARPMGAGPGPDGRMTREDLERRREDFQRQQEEKKDEQKQDQKEEQDDQQKTTRPGPGRGGDHRNFSPDRSLYVFAKGHNLYLVEVKTPATPAQPGSPGAAKETPKANQETKKETQNQGSSQQKAGKDAKKTEGQSSGQSEAGKKGTTQQGSQETQKQSQNQKQEKGKTETKDQGKKPSELDADPQTRQERAGATPPTPGASPEKPIPPLDPKLEETAIALSTDGAEDYSFAGGFGFGQGSGQRDATISPDRKTRPNVTWSPDSKAFYILRSDSRGVQDLWVINSLAQPRPTLEKYKYPMPGEAAIRKSELHLFHKDTKKLVRLTPKWKDETYQNLHFGKAGGGELRFIRRDRLLRNMEFCSHTLPAGETKCILGEGFDNANLLTNQYRYLDDSDEMIWWSERSGWGHFYLYDRNGNLKNPITSGPYRASRIVDVDTKNRVLYFVANGRESGENIYFEHLYSVRLDGTGLTLMDPGNANHRSTLSPSKLFLVDNHSRVDMAPEAVLRSADGKLILKLEVADLKRLKEAGWKMPETFVVKAADGVTDLYGNLWKPFDFDPKKKYPIIANVYPGPQMEGTNHTFAPFSGTQQLAQLGFIVIQVGHRGGAPNRSKAYASYGYFNLRDYGLEDKKYAIEQLAARNPWIDINRVGIYGHSGGGFMTAAALMQKPYNEFFKVGVSSAGNHDNNIYNNSWSERYHGLKEVEVKAEDAKAQGTQNNQSGTQGGGRGTGNRRGGSQRGGTGPEGELLQTEWETRDQEQGAEDLWNLINPEWTPPPHLRAQFGLPNGESQDPDRGDPQSQATQKQEQKQETGQKTGGSQSGTAQTGDAQTKAGEKKEEAAKKTKFEIQVPTNQELAANLKGQLLLIHGEIDNNVHPANTMRLVDALIKANKRFDMMIIPGKRHAFADYQPYVTQRTWEYFAEHLLGDRQSAADLYEKAPNGTSPK